MQSFAMTSALGKIGRLWENKTEELNTIVLAWSEQNTFQVKLVFEMFVGLMVGCSVGQGRSIRWSETLGQTAFSCQAFHDTRGLKLYGTHPKDEGVTVKCLAYRDSNPHLADLKHQF